MAKNYRWGVAIWFLGVLFWGVLETAQAQYRIQHQVPTLIERGETANLEFTVPGIRPDQIQDAFLFYKLDGDISFQQQRASLTQATFTIPLVIENERASGIEYYFEIQLTDGEVVTYPESDPSGEPLRVDIIESQTEEVVASDEVGGIEYTILSPEPGAEVAVNDVVIAIALFYEEGVVDSTASFELILDGTNITSRSKATEYFLSYAPTRMNPGQHAVELQLHQGEEITEIVSWNFTVLDAAASQALAATAERSGLIPSGQVELSARNQEIGGSGSDILRGNVRVLGQQGALRYSIYGLLTSEESNRLQPQNRYGAELYVGDWLSLQAGHIYPNMSPLTISGRRMLGVNTTLNAFNIMSFQFLYGQINRDVSNLYTPISPQEESFSGVVVDTSYTLGFQDAGIGTFKRDVIGGSVGLGGGQNFRLGFNFLKVEDDTSSVTIIKNYEDVLAKNPELANNLDQNHRDKLAEEPNLLSVNSNPRPKGNFIAGTDLRFAIDRQRIQFRADAAVSLLNEDIGNGPLDQQRADELGFEIDQEAEDLLDQLSWLIIINENMSALPLRFKTEGEETTAEPFFPTGIIGTQSELNINYFNNNLSLKYRWVGPDFSSLGNSTIRKDIAGLSLTDRFRLAGNRVYVTLGYENLRDNVINNKDATTDTRTYRTNVSWYPISPDLPRVSLGFMLRNRDNGVELHNPFVASADEKAALRNFDSSTGEIATTPRLRNTSQVTSSISKQFELFDINHDVSLSYSFLNTVDELFAFGDTRSNALSLSFTNRFRTLPLDTNLGITVNNTESVSGLTDISIFGFNLGGSMYFMEDRLNVNANLAFSKNRTESVALAVSDNGTPDDTDDDYFEPDPNSVSEQRANSFIFRAGAQYRINRNHAFVVDMSFNNVSNPLSSINPPNDRVLQARYVFSF